MSLPRHSAIIVDIDTAADPQNTLATPGDCILVLWMISENPEGSQFDRTAQPTSQQFVLTCYKCLSAVRSRPSDRSLQA